MYIECEVCRRSLMNEKINGPAMQNDDYDWLCQDCFNHPTVCQQMKKVQTELSDERDKKIPIAKLYIVFSMTPQSNTKVKYQNR